MKRSKQKFTSLHDKMDFEKNVTGWNTERIDVC